MLHYPFNINHKPLAKEGEGDEDEDMELYGFLSMDLHHDNRMQMRITLSVHFISPTITTLG